MEHSIGDTLQGIIDFQEINYRGTLNCVLGYTWGTVGTYRRDTLIKAEKQRGFSFGYIFSVFFNRPFYMSKGQMILDEMRAINR